ncbi:MAG: xanthine dehydrogenase family protein subunit M [Betaproteobacteria bacterium]|nr:xanthine dehydrogenase family protein subunit M [Betaproteobacteria bacterium]
MLNFNYHRPQSLAEAASLLGAKAEGKALAGGQTLVAALKLRLAGPTDLVDLAGVGGLKGISREGNNIKIGAMTTHAEVAASSEVKSAIPALAALAGEIGDRQVRNRGTLGGSIANNDPAADYPGAVLGLGATVHTNKRSIAADDFFTGLFGTALGAGEIITAVSFPVPKRAAYVKFKNQASRFALVGIFVAETAAGPRVAVTGAGQSGVFRVAAMETALAKDFSPAAVTGVKVAAQNLNSDLHATADYRAALISVLAGRAVNQARGG